MDAEINRRLADRYGWNFEAHGPLGNFLAGWPETLLQPLKPVPPAGKYEAILLAANMIMRGMSEGHSPERIADDLRQWVAPYRQPQVVAKAAWDLARSCSPSYGDRLPAEMPRDPSREDI